MNNCVNNKIIFACLLGKTLTLGLSREYYKYVVRLYSDRECLTGSLRSLEFDSMEDAQEAYRELGGRLPH